MCHSVLGLWARSIAFYCICDRIFDCIMVFVFFANSKEKPNWKLQLRISLFTSHTDCSFLFFLLSSLNLSRRKLRAILTSFSCLFCICDLFSLFPLSLYLSLSRFCHAVQAMIDRVRLSISEIVSNAWYSEGRKDWLVSCGHLVRVLCELTVCSMDWLLLLVY